MAEVPRALWLRNSLGEAPISYVRSQDGETRQDTGLGHRAVGTGKEDAFPPVVTLLGPCFPRKTVLIATGPAGILRRAAATIGTSYGAKRLPMAAPFVRYPRLFYKDLAVTMPSSDAVPVARCRSWSGWLACVVFCLLVAFGGLRQAAAQQSEKAKPAATEASLVQLNFPNEVEVKELVDYVSTRLKINILYDQEIANKKISVKAPEKIPVSSLLSVLESALKMKNLALVEADAPGWKRIVAAKAFANVAPAGDAAEAIEKFGKGTPVTQAFVLKHATPEQVDQVIKPFLSEPGANSIALPQVKTLIITDYATNLVRLSHWIEILDQPRLEAMFESVTVEHVSSAAMASQVTAILASKARVGGTTKVSGQAELIEDARTNQILLIGSRAQIDEAKQLISSLDVPLKLTTRTYNFKHVSAASIDRLLQQLVTTQAGNWLYRSAIDADENLLIVTASEEIHKQVEEIRTVRDVLNPSVRSPVRFYKVKNLPVNELLETIRSIEREKETGVSKALGWRQLPTDGRVSANRQEPLSGPNRLPTTPGSTELPVPPAMREPTPAVGASTAGSPTAVASVTMAPTTGTAGAPTTSATNQMAGPLAAGALQSRSILANGEEETPASELLGRARVSADVHTNTLIVVAEPAVQRLYAELIEKLDQRRLQVLIEAHFVLIDTTNDYSLGVEVSGGGQFSGKRLFALGSYGLSTVDAATGALAIIPGTGFNGTLLDPNVASAVIRAVSKDTRSRVTSAPRILVNDNAAGQLTSVQEVPFSSINASQTVATTSFAGFADAGTTITVTPHISDDTHLQLDFRITLNAFTGSAAANLPPPRETQEVSSQISIPDGHTVIVGGLNTGTDSYNYSGMPILSRIPIVRQVTGLTTTSNARHSMFIFLRPVILRDDKFRDLKYISEQNVDKACLPRDMPTSHPIWLQ